MRIDFTGTNSNFFGEALVGSDADGVEAFVSIADTVVVTPTRIDISDTTLPMSVVIEGTNMAVGENGPTSGTVTSITVFEDSQQQGRVSEVSWDFLTLAVALDQAFSDNLVPLAGLINSQGPLTVDASTALGGFDLIDALGILAPLITVPMTVTGSSFGDGLVGGLGADLIQPGGAVDGSGNGQENFVLATPGNDTIDFAGMSPEGFSFVDYSRVGPVTVNVDAVNNTGSVTGVGFTDTLLNVTTAMNPEGMGFAGASGDDVFDIVQHNSNTYIDLLGFEGNDTFNMVLEGTGRLTYSFGTQGAPSAGLDIDLRTGVVANDGHGFTDQINILGGDGRLDIRGTNLADTIIGSDRREGFIGEGGNDTFDGGGGFDRVRFDRSGVTDLFVDLEAGTATGFWSGQAFTQTLSNIEDVRGTRGGNDTLNGSAADERFESRGGLDVINARDGEDEVFIRANFADATITEMGDGSLMIVSPDGTDIVFNTEFLGFFDAFRETSDFYVAQTVAGNPVNDTLAGSGGNDTVTGTGGSDDLSGNGGFDSILGGIGFDTIDGGSRDDTLYGNDGYDLIMGASGNDYMVGNNGFDTLDGGTGNDTLFGGLGLDTMSGGEGDDELNGQSGFDLLNGDAGNDLLNGNAGVDTLDGGTGNDTLNGGINHDVLRGGEGDDLLNGNNGFDSLEGGAGDDRLEGNAGSDTLDGGTGTDVLRGGIGADTFVFMLGNGEDSIVDFGIVDRVQIDTNLFAGIAAPTVADLGLYDRADGLGNLVLDFDNGDTLTFTGIGGLAAIINSVDLI